MGQIYLNNAASAHPLAPGVIDAVVSAMEDVPHISGRDVSFGADSLQQCREGLAALLGVRAAQVVLTPNATYGLNAALLGLGLKKDDLVITTVTEHSSVLRPLARLADGHGIKVKYITDTKAYQKLLEENPKLVVLTHASNVSGAILPVGPWFKAAKAVGATTLLDAGQTAGRIPVRPGDLSADIVVFPGHKGLRGPVGTGALYVSDAVSLAPVFTGGTGVKSELRTQPNEMPMRLECGTPNTPAFAGLAVAVQYYMEHAERIAEKDAEMARLLLEGLRAIPKVKVMGTEPAERLPIVSFNIEGTDAETLGFMLAESFGVVCRAGLHCAPLIHQHMGLAGSVRFSASYANSIADIEYALNAVEAVASCV